MYEDSSRLKSEMSGWSNRLDILVSLYSPSVGMWVNLLKNSSGFGIADEQFGLLLISKLVSPLGYPIDYDTWPHVDIQFNMDIPPGSNVRYPDLVASSLQAPLAVTPSGYYPKLPAPPSGAWRASPLQATFSVTFYGVRPSFYLWRDCSCPSHEAKGNNKVELKLEVLVDLGVFLVSTL